MEHFLTLLDQYGGSVIGLTLGPLLLAFVGYMNWHGTIKADCVRWIARTVYHDQPESKESADRVFMGVTTFILVMGIMLVATALLFLEQPTV